MNGVALMMRKSSSSPFQDLEEGPERQVPTTTRCSGTRLLQINGKVLVISEHFQRLKATKALHLCLIALLDDGSVTKVKIIKFNWIVINYIIFIGVRHRIAAIKERLTDAHRIRRLIYAEQHINWNLINWALVLFIDEFSIESGEGGRLWVWRETNTRFAPQNVSSVSHTTRNKVSFILR